MNAKCRLRVNSCLKFPISAILADNFLLLETEIMDVDAVQSMDEFSESNYVPLKSMLLKTKLKGVVYYNKLYC